MTHLPAQIALELWLLRPFARQFVMLSFLAVMFVSFQDAGPAMVVAMAALTGSYSFAVTESAHLETLFATLPSTRRVVVMARYLVIGGILAAAGIAAVVADAVKAAISQRPWSPAAALAVIAISFAVASLVIAIQFPFFFRLGYLRARFLTLVAIAVVGAVIAWLALTLSRNKVVSPAWLETVTQAPAGWWVAGGLLLGSGFLVASAAVSIRLYARKDL